jgi:hypothetical protein
MKTRYLLECTIDLNTPIPELTAVISTILSALPEVESRLKVLRALDAEITSALVAATCDMDTDLEEGQALAEDTQTKQA